MKTNAITKLGTCCRYVKSFIHEMYVLRYFPIKSIKQKYLFVKTFIHEIDFFDFPINVFLMFLVL